MEILHKNTLKKAHLVCELVKNNYEAERHDRSKEWVLRKVVSDIYPISRSTFFRYLAVGKNKETTKKDDINQLKLWNDETIID
jgi:hypothetical protein